ncbi:MULTISPECIES: methyl-accepting chemotaxis protein [Paenibacillus]|uniref:methyl-accepting chemotaxis protein n=1 Tax=Paenibacillus TaxID=44249 RepID=UPI00031E7DB4|nr:MULTISPECIES: methyl-accepting chemotaxis protein [Paenibacillus]MDU8673771.1 methyl-accepting chemotaxis protein [Paenibacillus polymyxa]MDU8698677.1 methyl-accepting chemotaxis protein [Paenibacillus polymyxa]URJ53368.1 methyl-accepting chemotaxis protein [Paenibacillus polymyxa]URJ65220.1 methyl-accepting chemotaxis protein [Paenibacillus polymyxa]URJ67885.1 methyl-accepting chemotaxis protein [Paenibacillus polymyxa]
MRGKKFTMTIRNKVILTIVVTVITSLVIGGVGIYNLKRVQSSLEESLSIRAEVIDLIRTADIDLYQMLLAERSLYSYEPGSEQFSKQLEDYEKQKESAKKKLNKYKSFGTIFDNEEKLIQDYEATVEAYELVSKKVIDGLSSKDSTVRERANLLSYQEGSEKFDQMEDALDHIGDLYYDDNQIMLDSTQKQYSFLRLISILLTLAGLIASSLLGYLIIRSIHHPIRYLRGRVREIAEGNLAVDIRTFSQDELGQLTADFNIMVSRMKELISTVSQSIGRVNTSAHELTFIAEQTTATGEEMTSGINEIAVGASEQASLTEATSRETMALSDTIEKVNVRNKKMTSLSSEAEIVLRGGMDKVKKLQDHNLQTTEANQLVVQHIEGLAEQMLTISTIVQTINEVSEQTKLLALNASIEAARAGDSGKGFAVVATEIRKLSTMTYESTERINTTIARLKAEVSQTLQVMNQTEVIISEQSLIVQESGTVFESIMDMLKEIISSIQEMDGDIGQMNVSREQVISSIIKISDVARDAASATEEISSASNDQSQAYSHLHSAAEQLKQSSQQVSEMISRFRIVQE